MSTTCATSVTVMIRKRVLPSFGPSKLVTRMESFLRGNEDKWWGTSVMTITLSQIYCYN